MLILIGLAVIAWGLVCALLLVVCEAASLADDWTDERLRADRERAR